jgi:CRP-like cAMP-binding protein
VLEALPLFAEIGKRDLRRIAGDAEFAEFAPGESVVLAGERAASFYVILGGEAAVLGKPTQRPLTTGDFFGEIAMIDGERRSASVIAMTDLHVMRLRQRTFNAMLERHPSLARMFLVELGTRVRALERHAARRTT